MTESSSDNPASLAGTVLAATPQLLDPNFKQTLIFVANHDEHGAFGLVLNRPLGQQLSDVVENPDLSEAMSAVPVYSGGPVRPSNLVVALFTPDPGEQTMTCRLDGSLETAEDMLQAKSGWVRAFAGYSGWGEGQLENELADAAWQVCRPDPALFDPKLVAGLWSFFISGDDSWRKLVRYLPDDPSRN